MTGASRSWARLQQPQINAQIDKTSLLAGVLDHAWTGTDLNGKDLIGNYNAVSLATTLAYRPPGAALSSGGSSGTGVAITPVTTFPFFLIGYGYFSSTGNNWQLMTLYASTTGYLATLRLETGSTVSLTLQYNFGTTQIIQITPTIMLEAPHCMIAQVFSATDYRLYVDGKKVTGTTSPGTITGGVGFDRMWPPASNLNGGMFFQGYGVGRTISDADAVHLSAHPEEIWKLFKSRQTPLFTNLAAQTYTPPITYTRPLYHNKSGVARLTVAPAGSTINPAYLKQVPPAALTFGVATLDFGSHPGSNEASITLTGLAFAPITRVNTYTSASDTTSDHTANDHKYLAVLAKLSASPSNDTITISCKSAHALTGTFKVRYSYT
jgi:hypothetical protein